MVRVFYYLSLALCGLDLGSGIRFLVCQHYEFSALFFLLAGCCYWAARQHEAALENKND